MRLLNIYSLQFAEFSSDKCPPYITTSHRWSDDETTYQDVKEQRNTDSIGYKKLEAFCAIACKDNESLPASSPNRCDWMWSDSSCIDKTSSAEVTESINSMFSWYRKANHCLAYLADVRPLSAGTAAVLEDFGRSEWFKRGWTLQELLAPRCVTFLTSSWEVIGHKCSSKVVDGSCPGCCQAFNVVLNQQIARITMVPEEVLWDYEESKQLRPKAKWNWTENRKTTRPEDAAYCLLGIFDVYMPLIYGEGAENATVRLRQEIAKRRKGQSPGPRRNSSKQCNVFSEDSTSSFPFDTASFFHSGSRKTAPSRSNTASDNSDRENAKAKARTAHRKPDPAQRATAGDHLSRVEKARLAGLRPGQIAVADHFLPVLDLEALRHVRPAQMAAAGDSLPNWDLKELARLSPAEICKAAMFGGMKQPRAGVRVG